MRGTGTAARPWAAQSLGSGSMTPAVHHIELWTNDLRQVERAWSWLLHGLGWHDGGDAWDSGRTWHHSDGTYLVLEQSPAVTDDPHDRMRPGLNHLAVNCTSRELLDRLRDEASAHGWKELFGDRYPHAGGPGQTALFLENEQGFEVELVSH